MLKYIVSFNILIILLNKVAFCIFSITVVLLIWVISKHMFLQCQYFLIKGFIHKIYYFVITCIIIQNTKSYLNVYTYCIILYHIVLICKRITHSESIFNMHISINY